MMLIKSKKMLFQNLDRTKEKQRIKCAVSMGMGYSASRSANNCSGVSAMAAAPAETMSSTVP